ncbi:ankyrin repeat and zinc finger domain-containing protein 1 isoform X1 [Astyanax mexicanus]|uniref:ankyrin repeat and zinc finger domain-containing protein 1 isoform X1 n=1 Tax=Astyanax mexicanus TaxID=7994 RepID=UPI0020CABA59|nr:ankyrin repeat and zinc finger domain-containing protein 1 isoform X1 [Astyanax mexicanus]XP_049340664.1 ankyrin repeat and zinc finger domain-containing protein 1 isoform X1 [Astyanax mexicanus]
MAGVEQRSVFEFAGDLKLINGLREVSNLPSLQGDPQPTPESTASEGFPNERSSSRRVEEGVGGVSDRMLCSACQCPFESRDEQMEHYKLDWHRFNLRQRLAGRAPLSVEEFEKKTGTGDLSSISGSDSEDDEVDDVGDGGRGDEENTEVLEGGRSSSRVVFQNSEGQYVSLYRCVLQSNKTEAEVDLVDSLLKISDRTVWVILMTGGGHFAGAVFKGNEILQHKTFHRYTVRAKRGTAQSVRDGQNRSHAPKSAGAALRRYNEAALVKEIQDLLKNWAEYLKLANAVFLRTPKYNRGVFFGGRGAPLEKRDGRIRSLPFATRRATFSEIQRVHNVLSTLQVYDRTTEISSILSPGRRVWQRKTPNPAAHPPQNPAEKDEEQSSDDHDDDDEGSVELEMVKMSLNTLDLREYEVKPNKKRRRKKRERKKDDVSSKVENEDHDDDEEKAVEEDVPIDNEEKTKLKRKPKNKKELPEGTEGELWEYSVRDALYTACKTGDTATLHSLLQLPESPVEPGDSEHQNPTLKLLNTPIDSAGYTLLHVASAAGQKHAVRLLLEAGSDPASRDKSGQTPYAVAEKDTRNTFRKFMAEHPNKYDYAKAQVPGPLTAEIESKKAEKKKAQRAARKQREKEQKEEKRREEEEEEERKRFLSLSDREKRALAAERRLAEQAATDGIKLTNIKRCWQCGESLLGKIPFEYLQFSFCSPRCVQSHRKANATAKP